jgi:hypothetical protein
VPSSRRRLRHRTPRRRLSCRRHILVPIAAESTARRRSSSCPTRPTTAANVQLQLVTRRAPSHRAAFAWRGGPELASISELFGGHSLKVFLRSAGLRPPDAGPVVASAGLCVVGGLESVQSNSGRSLRWMQWRRRGALHQQRSIETLPIKLSVYAETGQLWRQELTILPEECGPPFQRREPQASRPLLRSSPRICAGQAAQATIVGAITASQRIRSTPRCGDIRARPCSCTSRSRQRQRVTDSCPESQRNDRLGYR